MKYNDNGIYRDLYIKSFDTVPIGTEVDFNGTNIPDGWEEVDNVLWTNGDLTSSFAPQTVTLSDDIENYEYYEVLFKFSTSRSSTLSISTGKIKTGMITVLSLPVGTNYSRTITSMSGKNFKFGPGGSYATYGTTTLTVDNTYLIPYKIIGYKGRIRKTSQYINGGASLSSTHGTSSNNGYTQEYLNNKLVHVGPEIDDNSKVNFIKSKNLYDKEQDFTINGVNHFEKNVYNIRPNSQYTLSFIKSRISGVTISNSTVYDAYIRYYDADGNEISIRSGVTSSLQSGSSKSFVINFTTPENTDFIIIWFGNNNGDSNYNTKVSNIMLNYGNTAFNYETYIMPSIVVDSEEIYSKDNLENYSTAEQKIGTWNGKPLYRKLFIGTTNTENPNSQLTTSGDIAKIIGYKGYVEQDSSAQLPIGDTAYWADSGYSTRTRVINVNNNLRFDYSITSFANKHFEVAVEYTKTTD